MVINEINEISDNKYEKSYLDGYWIKEGNLNIFKKYEIIKKKSKDTECPECGEYKSAKFPYCYEHRDLKYIEKKYMSTYKHDVNLLEFLILLPQKIKNRILKFTLYMISDETLYNSKKHNSQFTIHDKYNDKNVNIFKYRIGDCVIVSPIAKWGWKERKIYIRSWCKMCYYPTNNNDIHNSICKQCDNLDRFNRGLVSTNNRRICKICYNVYIKENEDNIYCTKCDYISKINLNLIKAPCKNGCYCCFKNKNKNVDFEDHHNSLFKAGLCKINLKHKRKKEEIDKLFLEKSQNEILNKKYEYKTFKKIDFKEIKEFSNIYINKVKKLAEEMENLEKLYKNLLNDEKRIKEYYKSLQKKPDTISLFKIKNSRLNNLFNQYREKKVDEYNLIIEIGKELTLNKYSKEEIKELKKLSFSSRSSRYINLYKRIYQLSDKISLEQLALSGISNFLRDASDYNFNLLLNLVNNGT